MITACSWSACKKDYTKYYGRLYCSHACRYEDQKAKQRTKNAEFRNKQKMGHILPVTPEELALSLRMKG